MLLNELAQWAAMILLTVVVYGLVRQLGHFLVPRREQLLYLGPDLDKRLPNTLLEGVPIDELRRRILESTTGLGLLVAMTERCIGCQGLVEQLEALGSPTDGPLIGLVDSGAEDFNDRIEKLFSYVLYDVGGQRARDAGIIATPFVLAFDVDLMVKRRGISGGLHELMNEWDGSEVRVGADQSDTRSSQREPAIPKRGVAQEGGR